MASFELRLVRLLTLLLLTFSAYPAMASDGRSDDECKDTLYALVLSKHDGYSNISDLADDLWFDKCPMNYVIYRPRQLRISLSLLASKCSYTDVHDFLCTGMSDLIEPVLSENNVMVIYRARQTTPRATTTASTSLPTGICLPM